MILVRQEPSWDEAIRHAEADTLIGKVRAAGWNSAAALLAHAAADRRAAQAVGCDLDQWTPGMIHRVSRLAARPDFQAVVTAQTESGATEPRGLGLLAEWVLACQSFATAARELAPKQELVDKAQKGLPDRIREYEEARQSLEEVIGEGCWALPPPTAATTPTRG